jgi:hypothetical protein
MEAPTDPTSNGEAPDPDPDLAGAVSAVDPADKAAEVQDRVEREAKEGDEQALKQIDLQGALREAFGYIDQIGSEIAPPFSHDPEQLDNLAVLWSEVLKDVEREKLMQFIEKMPLVAAGAYTVVTTGPRVRDSIQYIQNQKGGATLETPSNNDTDE